MQKGIKSTTIPRRSGRRTWKWKWKWKTLFQLFVSVVGKAACVNCFSFIPIFQICCLSIVRIHISIGFVSLFSSSFSSRSRISSPAYYYCNMLSIITIASVTLWVLVRVCEHVSGCEYFVSSVRSLLKIPEMNPCFSQALLLAIQLCACARLIPLPFASLCLRFVHGAYIYVHAMNFHKFSRCQMWTHKFADLFIQLNVSSEHNFGFMTEWERACSVFGGILSLWIVSFRSLVHRFAFLSSLIVGPLRLLLLPLELTCSGYSVQNWFLSSCARQTRHDSCYYFYYTYIYVAYVNAVCVCVFVNGTWNKIS